MLWAMVVMEFGDEDRVVVELCEAWDAICARCVRCVVRVAMVLFRARPTVVCSWVG